MNKTKFTKPVNCELFQSSFEHALNASCEIQNGVSAGSPNKYTYTACWFFKFISPDINGMQWAVGSHRSGNCTKTFTGYVVTAYNQSFTNRKEEKSRKKLQYCTSESYSWKLGYCRTMSISTCRFSIHCSLFLIPASGLKTSAWNSLAARPSRNAKKLEICALS